MLSTPLEEPVLPHAQLSFLTRSGLFVVFSCRQVPQEPGHLPGVKGQHKDQLCHQLSGDQ